MPHRILSLQQAARHIRIPERELFHLVQRDEIPFLRQGDDVVFEHRVLDDWAQRRILGLPSRMLSEQHRQETVSRAGKDSSDILIERLCRPEWIHPALSAKTKPGVIRDMVDLAVTTGLLYDDAALHREIEERESAGSTAIGGGAAFLHARYHDPYYAADSFVVLGKAMQQIFYGAQDGAPTDLFFLICCTDDALHLHVLARLCMMAHGTMLLSDLRAATTGDEMYQTLRHAELDLLKAM
ncbi:MAG TPA: PTS sugar transporter subunit IIA [Kiritimatiellia bacterium]|mgnify:CR=1 FL=1|nr:PTS sugar transporter subunit IIA [Kiritimatiellia bacterium]HRU70456.1 PTS sugar transporter subunit IIA [Kiritimatiellia bacterium]